MIRSGAKEGFHPRNRFRDGYDFRRLAAGSPALARFVRPNPHGDDSIDFANPGAVKALNAALLKDAYGIGGWELPPGALCPGVPGRSDALHRVADLLAASAGGTIPRGPSVAVLDLCLGASCIVPLIGASEYGWRFVGSDIAPTAVAWAAKLARASPVSGLIECRLQAHANDCFEGVIKEGELFDAITCNPPFHASAAAAAAGTQRKIRNLQGKSPSSTVLNFGGRAGELYCEGGELGFVQRMIRQSTARARSCLWFTTLVSKSENLRPLERALRTVHAADVQVAAMAHGQKRSRILAWSFHSPDEQAAWSRRRDERTLR